MRPNGCPHCGGADLEAEVDRYFCFGCGGQTDMHGNALPRDPQFLVEHTVGETQHGA